MPFASLTHKTAGEPFGFLAYGYSEFLHQRVLVMDCIFVVHLCFKFPDTCMTTWLGSTSLAPEAIANAELALRELSPPVDDRTKGTANRILLNAILGSSAAADGFLAPCTGNS